MCSSDLTEGSKLGHAFRDLDLEQKVLKLSQETGIGAQFGGKYFCHDVRVIRLPRHGASCPVAMAVSCSADRQAVGKITKDGVFLEQLETDPARFLPDVTVDELADEQVVHIDLNRPMADIRAELARLLKEGCELVDSVPRPGAAHSQIAFVAPGSFMGVLTELLEYPKGR